MKNRQHTILQNVIYLIIWVILIVVPVFGYRDAEGIRWGAVLMFWARMIPFFLLFVINNYWLIPRLLVKRRYKHYLVAVALSITAVLALNQFFVRTYLIPSPMFRTEKVVKAQNATGNQQRADTLIIAVEKQSAEQVAAPPKNKHYFRPARWQYLLMDSIVSILLIGTNAAICLMFLSIADRERLQKMESQTLKSELDYLKAQINPHFFMNTLNNIHALVDIDAERAKESIIELSKIMRYVLYDTNLPLVPLGKEVEFIDNYVKLMRMRYSDEVAITTHYPNPLPDVKLPPLMLVALIENAFKHGISYQHQSFIETSVTIDSTSLVYRVENSYFGDQQQFTSTKESGSGVGLSNLRKRLELLFANDGELVVDQRDNRYIAILKLPLR